MGEKKVKWTLPKALLCQSNEFFRAALEGGFKEKDGVIEMPEDDPEAFGYFIRSAYAVSMNVEDPHAVFNGVELPIVIRTCLFAYKYSDEYLHDEAISRIYYKVRGKDSNWEESLFNGVINDIFEKTNESAPIRTLVTRWLVWSGFLDPKSETTEPWDTYTESASPEALKAVLKELSKWRKKYRHGTVIKTPNQNIFFGDTCDYELYAEDEEDSSD